MSALTNSILAAFLVSLTTLAGIVTLFFTKRFLDNIVSILIALSTGTLLGAAFLDLLPEASEVLEVKSIFIYLLAGIIVFFLVERLLFWYHCHDGKCDTHKTMPYMILFGDAVHTFIDGVVLAATFLTDTTLGIAATIAIVLHELPHELSDFFVLIYSGFSRTRALLYNLLVASMHFVGILTTYYFYIRSEEQIAYLLPIAAGGFIYIALADLMPELHKEVNFKKIFLQLVLMFVGIYLITLL